MPYYVQSHGVPLAIVSMDSVRNSRGYAYDGDALLWSTHCGYTVTPQGTASAMAGLAVTPPQRAPPQPPPAQFLSAQPSRMAPSLEEISALPKLKLTKPPRSCEAEPA